MKKNLLIGGMIGVALILSSASAMHAQTKFIAYRSHSGIDRLFDPEGAGNFGVLPKVREWIQVDTISRPDTSPPPPTSIHLNVRMVPGEAAPESTIVNPQDIVRPLRPVFQLKREVEVKERIPETVIEPGNLQQPETPKGEIQVKDSAVKLEEPSISGADTISSSTPPAAQAYHVDTPSDSNREDGSGPLSWLALGLGVPAAMVVLIGIRRRNREIG